MMQVDSIAQLKAWDRNPRVITDDALAGLKTSVREFGDLSGIVFNERNRSLVCGHQRLRALREQYGDALRVQDNAIMLPTGEGFPIRIVDWDDTRHAAANIAANNEFIAGEFSQGLADLLDELRIAEPQMEKELRFEDLRLELKELWGTDEQPRRSLVERFIVPPFTIFDTRQQYWQDRKRAWIEFGIESELGREGELVLSRTSQSSAIYVLRNRMREALGRDPSWDELLERAQREGMKLLGATSIFDPVLCEVLYSWFCLEGGIVLDPFAGGSVRGLVAAKLGLDYSGIELRLEQIEANERQVEGKHIPRRPAWIHGDSRDVDRMMAPEVRVDFVFSCPPYYDLEVYSEDPNDLSNAPTYEKFLASYAEIIRKCVGRLNDNRFACFVVSDIRDKKGFFRGFVGDTVQAFVSAGALLYNHAILINTAASLPVRVGQYFPNYRKLGKTHQDVLVFFKGDPKVIPEIFPRELRVDAVDPVD